MTSDRALIEARLRGYLAERHGLNEADLLDDPPLLRLLGSMGVLELVIFLQREFELSLAPQSMSPGNLGTLARAVDFVESLVSATRT